MGTKVAPPYATLVLEYLEENLYEKISCTIDTHFSDFCDITSEDF